MRLRAITPISHHDPGQKDKSNKSLFRRQAQNIEIATAAAKPTQEVVNKLCEAVQVPLEVAPLLQEATLPQFLAAALMREFISVYGGRDGEGLFSGSDRYRFLEERFGHAAVQSANLYEFWGRACSALLVGAPQYEESRSLLTLLSMPALIGQQVLHVLAATPRPCVMLARVWADAVKRQNESYAKAAGTERADTQMATLHYTADTQVLPEMVVDMPIVSANTLRHQLIREPGMWHLFHALDLGFDEPLPAITAAFYNGGDIKPGASEPGGIFWIRKAIREKYPLLALISGNVDSFILGEGNLNVYAWLRCRENNRALKRAGLETQQSVFDLIDEWTLTRHANRVKSGQMAFSFETLVAGTEIIVNLSLSPYASDLEIGALMASLKTYTEVDATVGGQSARGFGLLDMDFHDCEPDMAALGHYETYLAENRDALRGGLIDGTLSTGKQIVT